jgi:hypothetical protein
MVESVRLKRLVIIGEVGKDYKAKNPHEYPDADVENYLDVNIDVSHRYPFFGAFSIM